MIGKTSFGQRLSEILFSREKGENPDRAVYEVFQILSEKVEVHPVESEVTKMLDNKSSQK